MQIQHKAGQNVLSGSRVRAFLNLDESAWAVDFDLSEFGVDQPAQACPLAHEFLEFIAHSA